MCAAISGVRPVRSFCDGAGIVHGMREGRREPKQGRDRGSRRLFLVIFALIVVLFGAFLILRPKGSDVRPPQSTTQAQ